MTDQIKTNTTVTITLDIEELLQRGGLLGYRETQDGDEVPQFADSLLESIVQAAAAKVSAALLKDEFRTALRLQVETQVHDAVSAALAREMQQTDQWGRAQGEAKTLEQHLVDKATDEVTQWMKRPENDRYNRNENSFGAFLKGIVDKAVREDLNGELAKAREAVTARVKAESARLVAEAAAKAVRL
jgi:hypothetical protein